MPQTFTESPLLSRTQAAEFLGVAANTLAVWACTHRYSLPYVKVGRKVAYRRVDLERWLATRTVNR